MTKENKELQTKVSDNVLAQLKNSYPQEASFNRILLPRLGLRSQDVTEGKGKLMKVVAEAGTFFIEKQTDKEDENGKKLWEKTEIGTEVEGIILFQRKQLRFYDSGTEEYTSSPVYDTDEEIVPLFCQKTEIARGTPKELRARPEYQGLSAKGKPMSKLEENRILYVLVDEEVYQLNLRGTSMYAFMAYARAVLPPAVVTKFSSEAKENGSISWSQMKFDVVRPINDEEGYEILAKVEDIKHGIKSEKEFYAGRDAEKKAEATAKVPYPTEESGLDPQF